MMLGSIVILLILHSGRSVGKEERHAWTILCRSA